MPVFRLAEHLNLFPSPLLADPSGVLAVGGDLTVDRLKVAYSYGIFPWYSEDQPILWWFPDPRCVLYPDQFRISGSLRTTLRQAKFIVTFDRAFEHVIEHCQNIRRKDEAGTWIMPEMRDAYCALHRAGYAHSLEVWKGNKLVGGLYGVAMGRIFYGESMFSLETDASKVGLAHLVDVLVSKGFWAIDCQQDTPHLRSLGAELVDAKDFYDMIHRNQVAMLQDGVRTTFP